ncbi:MAG: hypothetical protein EZS28_041549 [Streblomastix strix]|uniref:Uncharacterized protein n=1 Tax=Streblomastix strix TaxID=222440 RepID=A0A5J4TX93_9EUKA|nr:MAG: hypothetical protein EZS28_041549 [Streblomastix strix]
MWEISALRRINKLADAYSSRLDALLTHRAASIVSASQEPQQQKNEKQDNKEQKLKKEGNNGWEEDEQEEEDIEDINQIENEDSNQKLKTEYDHELKHLREYTFKRSIEGIRSDKESTIAFVSGILRAIADVLGRSEVMNEAN